MATVPAGDGTVRDTHGFLLTPLEAPRTQTIDLNSQNTFVADLAAASGGRVMYADADSDLRAAFSETLDEFRNRYVLSYTPTGVSATGWHTLDVKLKSKKGKVTARRGYFAGDSPSSR